MDAKVVLRIRKCEMTKEMVSDFRFRAQMIYLGLLERSIAADALESMETTEIQELDSLHFREWTKDLKGMEITQVMTVPYEVLNVRIVMEDLEPMDRIRVRGANKKVLAQTHLDCSADVDDAVQVDSGTWCLMTANTMRERVKSVDLEKVWKRKSPPSIWLVQKATPFPKLLSTSSGLDVTRVEFKFPGRQDELLASSGAGSLTIDGFLEAQY